MNIDYTEIGKRIATRRQSLGLKQAQVCERAEINDKYLSHIETARTKPSIETIMKISAALEMSPNDLLLGICRDSDRRIENLKEKIDLLDSDSQIELLDSFLKWLVNQKI